MKLTLILLVLFCATGSTALAQSRAAGAGFDISAQNGIAFDADAGLYRASGEVQLVAGDWVVLADALTARLTPARDSIVSVEAQGQVYVQRGALKAQASNLLVRPAEALIEMRGTPANLQLGDDRLVTEGLVILDQDQDQGEGAVTVEGDFVLVLGDIRLSGRAAAGWFLDDVLSRFEARENVRVEGDGWLAAAERLSLDRETDDLILEGAVALQQGTFILSGNRVDYNLSTGSLNIDGQDNGRIRGALRLE